MLVASKNSPDDKQKQIKGFKSNIQSNGRTQGNIHEDTALLSIVEKVLRWIRYSSENDKNPRKNC